MEKNIKSYAHLYIGCNVRVKRKNDKDYSVGRICEVTRKSNHSDWIKVWFDDVIEVTSNTWEVSNSNSHHFFFEEDEIKPILRPLSSMTEEEREESKDYVPLQKKSFNLHYFNDTIYASNYFQWLLSKHFDLFGLIDAGLAIDATTLKTNG